MVCIKHLDRLASWLSDNNKWIKRTALNVIARIPMRQPAMLPEFKDLLPLYKKWLAETKDVKSQKGLQAVIKILEST